MTNETKQVVLGFLFGSVGAFLTTVLIDQFDLWVRQRNRRKREERVDALMREEMQKGL